MSGLISSLLLLTIQYVILDCTKRTLRMVYEPYGPEMCRELCHDLPDTFYFVQGDISCHRVSRNSAGSIKDLFKSCLVEDRRRIHATAFNFQPGLNVCNNHYEDLYQPNQLHLTSEASHKRDSYFRRVNHNVSLHWACTEGNLCVVRAILSQRPADINSRDKLGRTPIMAAVMKHQVKVFDFLVNQSCDLMAVDNNNDTVLHVACDVGNAHIVRRLIVNHTCNIESRGGKGMTPVMKSALHGHRDVLDLLVSEGCNVTILDDNMNNILHVACFGGHVDMVKYVLWRFNSDIESRGEGGRTPVMVAAHSGHTGVFDFLASNGCNISAVDDYKDNILHVACIGGHVEMVQHILNKTSIDIESKGKYGGTPVMRATKYGQKPVVNFLVGKQCNVTVVDDYMNNLLHLACFAGHLDMVKHILVTGKLPIDSRENHGRTPVMYAVKQGHIGIVEYLVSKRCNLTIVSWNGDTILHLACISGSVHMVKYILSQHKHSIDCRGQIGRTPVMTAANSGHLSVFVFLVNQGCNLTILDDWKNNILHVACYGGNVDIVKHILKNDVIRIESRGYFGQTPAMAAAYYGQMSVLVHLVNQGCKVMVLDENKNNILHLACYCGRFDIVKYIVEKHLIGIESKGYTRRTPVMAAAYFGHMSIFVYLVNQGCELMISDKKENTILHLACFGGNVNIVKHIVENNITGIERRGHLGQTPLMAAAYYGHISVFVYLVHQGCELKALDKKKNNVLHVACSGGHLDIVKHIVEKHVIGIESRGYFRWTPVMAAAYYGRTSVVKYLVAENCKLTQNDAKGRNILELACKRNQADVVKYLITIKPWPKTC